MHRVDKALSLALTVMGNVHHLQKISDFAGLYTPVQTAEFMSNQTIVGANVLMLENRQGVLLHLFSPEGAELRLDPKSLTITLR